MSSNARYAAWDGTQDPLGEALDIGDILEALGDDLLAGAGGRESLRRLLRRGVGGRPGLDQLQRRVRDHREALRRDLDVGGPFAWVQTELEAIVELEREALAARDDDDARFAEIALDALPPDPAGRLRALGNHEFASEDAAERLAQLRQDLQQQVLDAHLRELAGAVGELTPQDIAALAAMLGDLNAMLELRAQGQEPDFAAFMAKHGHLFPEQPASLDELLAVLARRARAMQQMLSAMTPAQRAQMADLARQAFDDLDLEFQLSQLAGNLARALGEVDVDAFDVPDRGGDTGPLGSLVDGFERLAELDDLDAALTGEYAGASLEDIDLDAVRRSLGQEAAEDLRGLRQIERELERAGVVKSEDGELVLTPRGARLLGEKALTSMYDRIRRQPDRHRTGADPEPTGQTRPWQFGDREPLAVGRTITAAVMRQAAAGTIGKGIRLRPEDLEVEEQEVRPRTATALLLDLSFSMPLQGHFIPAKRMALALHALIEGKHRQDSLHLIGFSDYARRLQPADLAEAGFERVYGTNMQHAFLLARRVLADDPRPVKQVIMVTDGEPTAHLVNGESWFNWPPVTETLEATLREGVRLARMGVRLNIFLLEDAPGLVAFAGRLVALTGGQVVQMSAEAAGESILSDYGLG